MYVYVASHHTAYIILVRLSNDIEHLVVPMQSMSSLLSLPIDTDIYI